MTSRVARPGAPPWLVSMAASALAMGAAGCGGPPLPEPAREPPCLTRPCHAAHEGEVPITVPFPPPPAKVDVIGDPPEDVADPVWVDGQWTWRGRGWVWERGKWWSRPASQYYAAPAIVRLRDGQLVWFAGSFRPFVASSPSRPSAPPGLPSSGPPGDKAFSP